MPILFRLFFIFAAEIVLNKQLNILIMVELKLSVVDCLALETLLSQLDSNFQLGDSFKCMVFRFRSALRESGVLPIKGELLPTVVKETLDY